MDIVANLEMIRKEIPSHVTLVAVSKMKPVSMVLAAFAVGQTDFGENRVQDLLAKYDSTPEEVQWHMIGHLQTNKVKYIAPFVHLIHGVDTMKLLHVINREGEKNERVINCLLQVHISGEETKFGFDPEELPGLLGRETISDLPNLRIRGLMGMASLTEDMDKVRLEFRSLKTLFDSLKQNQFLEKEYFDTLSMGMSDDFRIAIEEGSTMVRIGSAIFGERI
ncbi:MAG: YggS family pyridoxal phosphate-dependent enzyme [Bacteroidota bacterium]